MRQVYRYEFLQGRIKSGRTEYILLMMTLTMYLTHTESQINLKKKSADSKVLV